jgi:hypothetical protein
MNKTNEGADIQWETESLDSLYKWSEVGQTVTGLLLSKKKQKGDYGDYLLVDILTPTGEIAFACTKALTDELSKMQYQPNNTIVKIELTELKDTGKKEPFKKFKVLSAPATESRLQALGITVYATEAETEEF